MESGSKQEILFFKTTSKPPVPQRTDKKSETDDAEAFSDELLGSDEEQLEILLIDATDEGNIEKIK
jgi:hypothetical protein